MWAFHMCEIICTCIDGMPLCCILAWEACVCAHTHVCVCRLIFGLGLMESVQSSWQASSRKKQKSVNPQ